jgi:hypothetical protein
MFQSVHNQQRVAKAIRVEYGELMSPSAKVLRTILAPEAQGGYVHFRRASSPIMRDAVEPWPASHRAGFFLVLRLDLATGGTGAADRLNVGVAAPDPARPTVSPPTPANEDRTRCRGSRPKPLIPNASRRRQGAHNGLVAGSSPARPTIVSLGVSRSPKSMLTRCDSIRVRLVKAIG